VSLHERLGSHHHIGILCSFEQEILCFDDVLWLNHHTVSFVRLVVLCLLFSVTFPGLLSAGGDPLLEEPEIAPLPPEDTDVQEAPEFFNVNWTCEGKAVKPKSSSGSSGGGLVALRPLIESPVCAHFSDLCASRSRRRAAVFTCRNRAGKGSGQVVSRLSSTRHQRF